MRIMYTPPCDGCHKIFAIPPQTDEPIMVGFVLEDGKTVNYCHACLVKMAKERKGIDDGK